ncbi:CHAD domain-containing protein [Deinococcus metallilatus]|uniref:CHAD domain-containing protein n=1 Tax=Deinococcus metallilatus TaxID=1211322 RepID=A0AAJ5JY24_9DEIO|nr:CHAD domain-containing protein [Deinococcus metallilatus]MBB5296368.1 CHAD domain-containing protein [Deinococcus metallilatus]QBY09955.1 CHAD domain-containing protein [Deinococcus metallilatus]RXJ08679.1 CHAD domain-containing protein [Deinococcus metallilatus]TLK25153.1 CHAD domain-containing protein [Deinococcus metallilatus]GMA14718.1 CHAD domain-containing protein [Deinococcus metallilatus]
MSQRSRAARRLKTLWDDLRAGDPQAVHAARKLTRRAQAELRVADAGRKTERAWRDLRRAAAPLRDHDVAGGHLRDALAELGVPEDTLAYFDRTWAERRAALLARTDWPGRPPAFDLHSGWKGRARRLIEQDGRKLLRDGEATLAGDDPEQWHAWRKRLKRYRYTLSLLGEVPPVVTDTLEALGRLQDAEVVLGLLHADPDLLRYERDRLIAREEAARQEARARVRELFPALAEQLSGPAEQDGEKAGA